MKSLGIMLACAALLLVVWWNERSEAGRQQRVDAGLARAKERVRLEQAKNHRFLRDLYQVEESEFGVFVPAHSEAEAANVMADLFWRWPAA